MVRARDISDQRFSHLVALRTSGLDSTGKTVWECKCDCGNQVFATLNNLTSGNTKSCGCAKRKPRTNRLNLVGRIFGRLEVIGVSEYKNKALYWQCRCNCGAELLVSTLKLTRGGKISCGCIRKSRLGKNRGRSDKTAYQWAKCIKSQGECLNCGSTDGLHAHHINSWSMHSSLRLDSSNGAALCPRCHREFHRTYGNACDTSMLCEYLGLGPLETSMLEAFVGHKAKGGAEDIRKAIHYCQLILHLQYPESVDTKAKP